MKPIQSIILDGLSGKLGEYVLYQRNGKTFMRKVPGDYDKTGTVKQAAMRALFRQAQEFAKSIINDPVLKASYKAEAKRKYCSVYNLVMSEYMQANK